MHKSRKKSSDQYDKNINMTKKKDSASDDVKFIDKTLLNETKSDNIESSQLEYVEES